MDWTSAAAMQLAIMLNSGMPSRDALRYFLPDADEQTFENYHAMVLKSRLLGQAIKSLQGKDWQEMSLDEARDLALNKTYREAAYFLYANNYNDLTGAEKAKADTCRTILEQHKAGTSGQALPLEQWFADLKAGKVILPKKEVIKHAS